MKSLARKPVLLFLGLTMMFSAILYVPIIGMGMGIQGLLNLGIMWCPGLAAIITSLIYYKSLKGLGWGWGKTRWQLLSYFLPFVYIGAVYGLAWMFDLGKLDLTTLSNMGTAEGASKLFYLATVGTCITALGEEIGWRGFLTVELAKDLDWIRVALYSGIIWVLYHVPLILFGDYRIGAPIWFGLPCFTIMVIGTNFAYTWLRLKTNSLWTGVFLHGGHNFILYELDRLTINTRWTPYIVNEYGIGLAVAGVIVGLIFLRMGNPLSVCKEKESL